MEIPFVDLQAQYKSIKTEIDTAIAEVIEQTAFIGGKYGKQFEVDVAKELGGKQLNGKVNSKDWVHYGPSTHVILPAHTYVTMTIKADDSGEK